MEEQYFKPAIAANYFNPNRFRWELNERQASNPLTVYHLLVFGCCKCRPLIHISPILQFVLLLSILQVALVACIAAVAAYAWTAAYVQVEALLDLFLGVGAPWPPEGRQQRVEMHEAPAFVEDTTTRPYTIEPATRPRLEAHRERNSPYTSDARYDLGMFQIVVPICIKLAKPVRYCRAAHVHILVLLLLI